jgi:hypothetical protein
MQIETDYGPCIPNNESGRANWKTNNCTVKYFFQYCLFVYMFFCCSFFLHMLVTLYKTAKWNIRWILECHVQKEFQQPLYNDLPTLEHKWPNSLMLTEWNTGLNPDRCFTVRGLMHHLAPTAENLCVVGEESLVSGCNDKKNKKRS